MRAGEGPFRWDTSWRGRGALLNLSLYAWSVDDVGRADPDGVHALRAQFRGLGLDPGAVHRRLRFVGIVARHGHRPRHWAWPRDVGGDRRLPAGRAPQRGRPLAALGLPGEPPGQGGALEPALRLGKRGDAEAAARAGARGSAAAGGARARARTRGGGRSASLPRRGGPPGRR